MTHDYQAISQSLIPAVKQILPSWLPGGKFVGKEYMCSNLRGGNGDSLSVNIQSGMWADFATGEKGGDMVSLYAAIHGIGQAEAVKRLNPTEARNIGLPPRDATKPPWGKPSGVWEYKTEHNRLLGYITRFDVAGKKQITPWSWDTDSKSWQKWSFNTPRPLYGLELLSGISHVMIVEGEKSADAARILTGSTYVVVTWPGGADSVNRVDWSPLIRGRCNIVLWPDADEAGKKCMEKIANILKGLEIKIIDVSDMPAKWDAADAVSDGWNNKKFLEWAKPRISEYIPAGEIKPAVNIYTLYDDLHLTCGQGGMPKKNIDNVLKLLDGYDRFKDIAWYDEFHEKIYTTWFAGGRQMEWSDNEDIELTVIFQRDMGMHTITDDAINKAVRIYAMKNRKNEVKDWMESLKWDGEERISHCFEDALGAADTEYTRAVSKNFWLAMIARAYHPGCKYDNMIILEGKQGRFKSTALSVIGGKWYSELNQNISSTDFCLAIQGKLLIEIAELDAFSKVETSRIKSIVSRPVDRYRSPYGRATVDHPRQCVFTGTTNEDDYLKDHTGGRRFWPIKIGQIRLDILKENRNQYFAEAVVKYKESVNNWWTHPPRAEEEQESRRQVDVWESVIAAYIDHCYEVQVTDILTTALKVEVGKQDRSAQIRVSNCLKVLGWGKKKVRRGAVVYTMWFPGGEEL